MNKGPKKKTVSARKILNWIIRLEAAKTELLGIAIEMKLVTNGKLKRAPNALRGVHTLIGEIQRML